MAAVIETQFESAMVSYKGDFIQVPCLGYDQKRASEATAELGGDFLGWVPRDGDGKLIRP
ncbi:MAG: hypothetical protein AAGB23_05285 [Pseudomonadota bacterium]